MSGKTNLPKKRKINRVFYGINMFGYTKVFTATLFA